MIAYHVQRAHWQSVGVSNGVFYFVRAADFRCDKMVTIKGLNELS